MSGLSELKSPMDFSFNVQFNMKIVHQMLGVLPPSGDGKKRRYYAAFAWFVTVSLILISFACEILFTLQWYRTNPVSAVLAIALDVQIYLTVVLYQNRLHGGGSLRLENARIDKPSRTVIGAALLSITLIWYASVVTRLNLSSTYMAHFTCFLLVTYQCYLASVQFCFAVDASSRRIVRLRTNLDPAIPAESLIHLDAQKDNTIKLYSTALHLNWELLTSLSIDVFSRLVHYLYIIIWTSMTKSIWKSLDYILTCCTLVVFKFWLISLLVLTTNKAADEVRDFNRQMFKVVLGRKDLQKDEQIQLMVTRMNAVRFAPGGFFELGKRFMVSMVNAVAVYLVVLVQLSNIRAN